MKRIKIKKLTPVTYRIIPVRGSNVPEWPNDAKEIEVEDGEVFEIHDFYRVRREETLYPEGLIIQAFGKFISQADLWQMYRREDVIYLFIAKLI